MRTIVVTGATGGIGYEAAATLTGEGDRVVLVGRDPQRTKDAVARIQERTGTTPEYALADFASLDSVRALAADLLARLDRIDVLVNNAGAVYGRRELTEDGYEATFAVNHLAPYLLTRLLLDRITASNPARIVTVASAAHYRGTMDLDDLGFEEGYSIMAAYSRSKLANVLFTRALAARLAGSGVTANCLHPGTVRTNIWSGAPWWAKPVLAIAKLRMIPVTVGASRITYLVTSPEVADLTGDYFDNDEPTKPSRLARDDRLAERLWDASADLVGLA
ncbi:MAG: SDR family oxidoreductase [Nocardioidaceae bacterium]